MGPVQVYDTPVDEAVNDKVLPEQTGELLPVTGAAGPKFIVTFVVEEEPVQPATVTLAE